MLWTLIGALLVIWLLGLAFNIAGGIINVVLVIAVALLIVNLISGRRTTSSVTGVPKCLERSRAEHTGTIGTPGTRGTMGLRTLCDFAATDARWCRCAHSSQHSRQGFCYRRTDGCVRHPHRQ